jgi:hypothetical protein
LRVLRGMAWLHGETKPTSSAELIAHIERRLGRQLQGLQAVLLATDRIGWPRFQQLYEDVESLELSIDAG